MKNLFQVFWIFLRLGLTSFGGPVAHLSYFHHEFVTRRKWFSEETYADLVALCQFLPGPASSQVGMAIGVHRAGMLGAFAAWLGFTLPSALILIFFALGLSVFQATDLKWIHGLKIAAVAIVAHAVWTMGRKLCPDLPRKLLAVLACLIVLFFPQAWVQILVILLGGSLGAIFLSAPQEGARRMLRVPISYRVGLASLGVFFTLLGVLPLLATSSSVMGLKYFDSFYRSGALVFGGGHVILPLLHSEVVPPGWITNEDFMAGYGAAQAIPGPLFAFSAYLGAKMAGTLSTWTAAVLCLVAAFLPSLLLILGVTPFWGKWVMKPEMRRLVSGVNAAVVGLLLAAFYHPVWTSGITGLKDVLLAVVAFALLSVWKAPSWLVVSLCAVISI